MADDGNDWKWMFGTIMGFGDCFFEAQDGPMFANAGQEDTPDRMKVRRLTKADFIANQDGKGASVRSRAFVPYAFKILDPDTEISVAKQSVIFMAPASEDCGKECNKFWDPNTVIEANKSDLQMIENTVQQRRKGFGLVT